MVLGCRGTDEFAGTAAKLEHHCTIFVHLCVRTIILSASFKIAYTSWIDEYFRLNNISILLIILKENYRARLYDCRNTDMISIW